MTKEKKLDTFKFKINIPEKIVFQSDVKKEGESQYSAWKLYIIQAGGKDYSFFPAKGLQNRLDQLGNLEGKLLEICKVQGDNDRFYWQIFNEKGDEITPDYQDTPRTPKPSQNANLGLTERLDKASEAFKAMQNKINALETRVGVLEMEIKEAKDINL